MDVGAPLAPTNELTSVLSITNQLTTILTVRNVEQQVKTLGNKDVLIVPDLKDLGSTDFDRSPEAVIIGYDAAQASRKAKPVVAFGGRLPSLHRRAAVNTRYRPPRHRLYPDQEQHPAVRPNHRQSSADSARRRARSAGVNRNLSIIYGMGDFQAVDYSLVEENGKTGLIVEAKERYIGTDTLELGLSFGASQRGGESLVLAHRRLHHGANELAGRGVALHRPNRRQHRTVHRLINRPTPTKPISSTLLPAIQRTT
ncbi:MAG: hypothetical protein IPP10_16105 [Candidatus Competibacteraceae bacterium]|nr:hypothetical protein [Candidatus Competibacteraceae bacterium]